MKQVGRQLGQDEERKGGFCLGSSCLQAARSGRGRSRAEGWNIGCPEGAQEGSHWACWEAQALPEGLWSLAHRRCQRLEEPLPSFHLLKQRYDLSIVLKGRGWEEGRGEHPVREGVDNEVP